MFEDEIAFGGWPIDDHYPGGFYHKGIPNTDVQTPVQSLTRMRSQMLTELFSRGTRFLCTRIATVPPKV